MTKKHPPEDKNPAQNPPPYVVYPPEEPIDRGAYWKILVEQKKLIGILQERARRTMHRATWNVVYTS